MQRASILPPGLAGLLILAAALFVLFPAALLECDAVIYSCAGLAGDMVQSTDAGHLVWGFIELGASDLGRTFDPPVNPIFLLRWLSILAALLTIWLFHRTLRLLEVPTGKASLCSGVLLFSYSFWHFALQAEPHLPSTVFLMGFLYTAVGYFRDPTTEKATLAAVWLGLATLLHQTAILMVPAFLIPLALWPAKRSTWRRHIPVYTGAYFLTAIVPYLLVGWFVRDLRTVVEFKAWIMGLSTWGGWGYWTWTTPLKSIVGILRSLLGSHFMLGIGPVMAFADKIFPAASWDDELLLAGRIPGLLRYVLTAIELVLLAGVAWVVVGLPRRIREIWFKQRQALVFLMIWLGIYGGFIMWWAPERAEFWIVVILPALVIVAMTRRTKAFPKTAARLVGPLFLAGVLVVNFFGSIWPQSRADIEFDTTVIVAVNAATERGDFILSSTHFRGRAAKYVYSLEKLNLLKPSLARTSLDSPGAEGGPQRAGSESVIIQGLTVAAAVDSVLSWAAQEKKKVYLIKTPLLVDETQARQYRKIVMDLERRLVFSAPVPLRSSVEMVQVELPD